jgi:hypothetical protein
LNGLLIRSQDKALGQSMSGTDQLLEVSMEIKDFSSDWLHCDRISSYFAEMVAHNRADSLLYANLLSSALNELLETVFSNHGPDGQFNICIKRSGSRDVIELTLPCDDPTLQFYTAATTLLQRGDVKDVYQSALFSSGEQDSRLGLLEVAVDYQAKISIKPKGDRLTLLAEIMIEGSL